MQNVPNHPAVAARRDTHGLQYLSQRRVRVVAGLSRLQRRERRMRPVQLLRSAVWHVRERQQQLTQQEV